jgi:aspartate carbamoyltransferase regulatory subunit
MNIIQLEDAKNLNPGNLISKGADAKEIWKITDNFKKDEQVEMVRIISADSPDDMEKRISYRELSSGNWYYPDPSEIERLKLD